MKATSETVRRLKRILARTKSLAAAGREMGVTRQAVHQMCRYHGIPTPPRKTPRIVTEDELRANLLRQGWNGQRLAAFATEAERRGYGVELFQYGPRGAARVRVEGMRVRLHRPGKDPGASRGALHQGFLRGTWKITKPPELAVVAWVDGFEVFLVQDCRYHVRHRRIDGLSPLKPWPTPAEMRAAAVEMRRAA